MDCKPGDHFTVKVGDWEYDTVIDDQGVQRFVHNEAIKLMADGSTKDFDRANAFGIKPPTFDLNALAIAYYNGKIPLKDLADFHAAIGYSVSGFAGLSEFEDLEIINPLWDE